MSSMTKSSEKLSYDEWIALRDGLIAFLRQNKALASSIQTVGLKKGSLAVFTAREMSSEALNLLNAPLDWQGIPISYEYLGEYEEYAETSSTNR